MLFKSGVFGAWEKLLGKKAHIALETFREARTNVKEIRAVT